MTPDKLMPNSDNASDDREWVTDLSFLDHLSAGDSSFSVRPGSIKASFHAYAIIPSDVIYGEVKNVVAEPTQGERAHRGGRGIGPLPPSGRLLLYDMIDLEDERFEVMLSLFQGDTSDSYDIRGSVHPAPPENTQGRLSIDDKTYYVGVAEGSVVFKNVAIGGDINNIIFSLETLD